MMSPARAIAVRSLPVMGLAEITALAHQPPRYAGQYADSKTGLHYR